MAHGFSIYPKSANERIRTGEPYLSLSWNGGKHVREHQGHSCEADEGNYDHWQTLNREISVSKQEIARRKIGQRPGHIKRRGRLSDRWRRAGKRGRKCRTGNA